MFTKSTLSANRLRYHWSNGLAAIGIVVALNGCLPGPAGSSGKPNLPTPQPISEHLTLGNPSDAGTNNPDNYLLLKPQFVMSFNRSRGIINWVSWHLDRTWRGDAPRTTTFRPDPDLPAGYSTARNADYAKTGFDKGHLCPSEDRDRSPADNAATFVLSNVVPQAPNLNRGVWKAVEDYARKRVDEGNEVYIVAGVTGTGGEGENGYANSIGESKITVPASFWKLILILPDGDDDLRRIGPNTEVMAVFMPNQQNASGQRWQNYQLSVTELEQKTGLRFLSTLPVDLQSALKRQNGGRF